MSLSKDIKRFYIIVNAVKSKRYPSLKELKNKLKENDIILSDRTLQRCISDLRDELEMPIEFDHGKGGYFMDTDDQMGNEGYFHFLDMAYTGQFMMKELSDLPKRGNFFHFESPAVNGNHYLPMLLKAIAVNQKIKIDHVNYGNETIKTHIVHPYLLKEYQNRWYVVGHAVTYNDNRSFGLDRITKLEILDETFDENKADLLKENFDSIIGLNYNDSQFELVKLAFTPFQAKYIESLPWHSSQKIESETPEEVIISFYLKPNFELEQRILMHGQEVKVLQPEWLKANIKNKLELAINKYLP